MRPDISVRAAIWALAELSKHTEDDYRERKRLLVTLPMDLEIHFRRQLAALDLSIQALQAIEKLAGLKP